MKRFKRFWAFVGAAGYVFAVLVLFQFVTIQIAVGLADAPFLLRPAQASTIVPGAELQGSAKPTVGLPVTLKIPRIKISAAVRYVGLTPDGAMGVPKVPRDTAWYMLGPRPGEKGSAVIAGHVNWLYGAKGSFEHLKDLKPGDVITVQDDAGASMSFVVRRSHAYGRNEDATDVFRSSDGKAHLNLITCAGVWDRIAKMYTKRLVVFADKVE